MSFFRLPALNTGTLEAYKNYRGQSQATRIDRREEMHDIVRLVEKTRSQVAILKDAWEKAGAADPSYNKYPIMQDLLNQIDEKITEYNSEDQEDELSKEYARVHKLINDLGVIINSFQVDGEHPEEENSRMAIIKTKRNEDKSTARMVADVGLVGGAAALAIMSNVSFLVGMLYCGLAGAGGRVMSKRYNLDNDETESHSLIKNFHLQFEEASKKMVKENHSPAP